ncbi:MAG: hypothetical protein DCC67_12500 [Planctomycetota bacterium]|nr:MAG: hypothetical protein DCC67_12500 [Planctomycetota bacterium]
MPGGQNERQVVDSLGTPFILRALACSRLPCEAAEVARPQPPRGDLRITPLARFSAVRYSVSRNAGDPRHDRSPRRHRPKVCSHDPRGPRTMNRALLTTPPARPRSSLFVSVVCTLNLLAWGAAADVLRAETPATPATPAAAQPLHAQIDGLIDQAMPVAEAPIVDDAAFLRRASLDLIGVPPSLEEIHSFLAETNPDKRIAVVDRLLQHPRYAWHMAEVFDVMFMERRPSVHVAADQWRQYLVKAFRENKPYNQLAKEILSADGGEAPPRAAAKFYLDRLVDPHLLTRDVGRIFFGRDLQCAQCHDHPLVSDYHQADYHGLLACFSSSSLFTAPAPDGKAYVADKAGADSVYESVFVAGKHRIGPKLPGAPEMQEPMLYPDEQYAAPPAEGVRPQPTFSRRAKLAEAATDGTNRAFNENIANRLWAHMMGRGLVEPVDRHHADNPPANPPLMKLLGEALAASGFDIRAFLRELALTRAYQRSIEPPSNPAALADRAAALAAEMENQFQLAAAAESEADDRYTEVYKRYEAAEQQALPVFAELDQASVAATQAFAKLDEAKRQLAATEAQVAAKSAIAAPLAEAAAKTAEVVKALPQDQELVQAAEKFAQRQQQLVAEMGALQADAEQKSTVVKTTEGEAAAARQSMEAICTRLTPVAASLDEQDRHLTAARQAWADQKTRQTRLEQARDGFKRLAGLKALADQLAAASRDADAATAALAAARAAADAQRSELAAADQARQGAAEQVAAAEAALAAATAEQQRVEQLAATIAEAAAKTDAARQTLPADPHLAAAADALAVKLAEVNADVEVRKQASAQAAAAHETVRQQLAAASEQAQRLAVELTAAEQGVAAAEQALAAAQANAEREAARFDEAQAALDDQWISTQVVQPLKPLTPEQLCWSVLQITGVYDRYLAAERAELEKTAPLSDEEKNDPAKVAARDLDVRQRVYDKLKGNVDAFVAVYAPAAGQPQDDFFASANQALFAANGGSINSWVAPAGSNVTERMIAQADPRLAAEELYLAILGRRPTDDETADVAGYLAARPQDKAACVQELAWALITSAEFRFNH